MIQGVDDTSQIRNVNLVSIPKACNEGSFETPKIYTTTGLVPRKNREMAGVDDLVVYMQTVKNTTLSIYTTPGARSAPRVVYIQTAVSVRFQSSQQGRPT